jgi:hydrogenase expression/formation protein HypC
MADAAGAVTAQARGFVVCLAVPGRVLEVEGDDPAFLRGRVDFSGVRKEVSFAYTPDVHEGDYVLVHVGFAIQKIDEEEAERNRLTLDEILAEFGGQA